MATKEKDALDGLLFAEGVELLDLKCFRGDKEDVSEEEIKEQIHSAIMQKRMRRAVVSNDPPRPKVQQINARELLSDLAK